MKNIPYYSEQHMRRKGMQNYSGECVEFCKDLYRGSVYGDLPVSNPQDLIQEWRNKKAKNKYWLKFDIQKFYLFVDHSSLLSLLDHSVTNSTGLSKAKKEKYGQVYRLEIEQFLKSTPFPNKTLPIASRLGRVLSEIYLLPLVSSFRKQNIDFLYFADDFLLFFPTQKKCDTLYWNILLPLLEKYHLSINIEKTMFGKSKDSVSFMGYLYRSGAFSIEEKRVSAIQKWVKNTIRKCSAKGFRFAHTVHILNKKLSGFFHYYAWGNVKTIYREIDTLVKSSLQKAYFGTSKINNFQCTKNFFQNSGLVFGLDIYQQKIRKNPLRKHNIIIRNKITELKYLVDELEQYYLKYKNRC